MTVLLTKASPSVNLSKSGGIMDVTLSWGTNTDADLCCLWKDTHGNKGIVQALGNDFGDLDKSPHIKLLGDSRAGGTETLQINLAHASEMQQLLLFAYVYAGENWRNVGDAYVTARHPSQGSIEVDLSAGQLSRGEGKSRSCALISVTNVGGELRMQREAVFFRGVHDEIDRHYGWGIDWTPGSK